MGVPVTTFGYWFYDPQYAYGYLFTMQTPSEFFTAVEVPGPLAESVLTVFYGNGNLNSVGTIPVGGSSATSLGSNTTEFEILGLSAADNLDPANASAFVVGLTFSSGTTASFNVDPLTAGVPEPSTLVLLGISAAGMAVHGWRRRKSA